MRWTSIGPAPSGGIRKSQGFIGLERASGRKTNYCRSASSVLGSGKCGSMARISCSTTTRCTFFLTGATKRRPTIIPRVWIRQWFGMIRDANMNHSRLHTHPHPRAYLDLADEEGILITGETGIFGSGGSQAADSEEYWANARDHVRRFAKRDKNHPSIVLWSVENEMRWNRYETNLTMQELPKLKKLCNDLDPTRPAYHEGDSSLWNEKRQDIISRHYGKECSGTGWWDRAMPLHSGEMCLYHYAGPNCTLHLGGDLVFKSFKALDEAAATDAAYIIEDGRINGVCCFGPWNLSCLENLRACKRKDRSPL